VIFTIMLMVTLLLILLEIIVPPFNLIVMEDVWTSQMLV